MSTDPRGEEALFARLLCDVMIPAELSEALRAQGYDVAEAWSLSIMSAAVRAAGKFGIAC